MLSQGLARLSDLELCFHSSYAKWWFTGCFSAVFRLWPLDQYLCTKCYRSVISVQSNKNKWQKPGLELCIFALIGLGIYILLFKSISPAKSEWSQMTSILHCTVLPTTEVDLSSQREPLSTASSLCTHCYSAKANPKTLPLWPDCLQNVV